MSKKSGSSDDRNMKKSRTSRSAGVKSASARKSSTAGRRAPAVDQRTLARLVKRLNDEKSILESQFAELEEERRLLAEDREDTDDSFSEESGEGATVAMEQEKDFSLSANALELLEKVNAALDRVKKGTYGHCGRCGDRIAKARLEALPYAELCVTCQQKEERRY